MNSRAIIFQRNSIGSKAEQEAELAKLEAYANDEGLEIMAVYVASNAPHMLSIQMLIGHCMDWAKPGHIVVTDLSRLWIGPNTNEIVAMLASAGAIVHVVPNEVP